MLNQLTRRSLKFFPRLKKGQEVPLPGHDKATFLITSEDMGCRLKVTVIPTVKETNEMGQPVTAISPLIEVKSAPALPRDLLTFSF